MFARPRRVSTTLVLTAIFLSLAWARRAELTVGVSVSPDAGGYPDATIRLANTTGNQVTFTVTNTGDIDTRYSVTCTPGGAVVSITTCPTIGIIAAGLSKPATVSFTTGSAGSGSVSILVTATTPTGASATGKWNETVANPAASVTPHGGSAAFAPNTASSSSFTVTNTGTAQTTYTLAAVCSGAGVTGCSPSPASVTLSANQSQPVTVSFTTQGQGTTAVVELDAQWGGSTLDAGTINVTVYTYGVSVTPHGGAAATRTANTGGYSETFTVTNTGSASNTFSFACSGVGGVTCGTAPTSVTLAGGAQTTVSQPYSVGAPGTGTLTLTASGTNASDAGSYSVPIVSYGVSVTPDGGAAATRTANTGGYSETFTVTNTGSASNTFSFACSGVGGVTCGTVPAAVTLGAGLQTTVSMPYSVGAAGTGTLTLTASGTNASDPGSYSVPIVSYGVSVTPDGGTAATRTPNTGGYSETFTVTNTGSGSNTYSFSCSGASGVTCGTAPTSVTLAGGAQTTVSQPYSVGAPGTGTLTLTASGTNASDPGSYSVPIVAYGVSVTPDGGAAATRTANTGGYSETFTVTNTGSASNTFSFTCAGATGVTCGTVPAAVTIGAGLQTTVTMPYSVGAAGTGTLTLTASGTNASDPGSYSVPIVAYGVSVTPHGATAPSRVTNTSGYTAAFTVQNTGSGSNTYTLTCSGSSNVTCTSLSQTSVTLGANVSAGITAFYNVGATGTGTLTLSASGTNASDGGSYSIPVISYGVAVTPDSGEELPRRPNGNSFTVNFTLTNTGTATDTFSFTCTSQGTITCSRDAINGNYLISPLSAILAGGAQATVGVTYKTGGETGTSRVYLNASSMHSADQGWFFVPVTTATAAFTPANGWSKGAFTSSSYTATFVLSDPDTLGHSYALSCYTSANVTCDTASLGTLVFTAGQSQNVNVGYTVGAGASGDGYVHMSVNGNDLVPGKLNFHIWPNVAHAVAVTPALTTGPNLGSFTNGYTSTYTVRNVGTSSDTYTFTCVAPSNVTCGTVTPSSLTLASLDTTRVTVNYNVGATGSAYVSLQASNASANNTGQMSFTIVPSVGYAASVTPHAKNIGVLVSTSASYPFTVWNPGTAQNTYTISAACSGSAIASGCTPSATSVTLAAGAKSTVTVSYTSGGASTTGKITLKATQSTDGGVLDTGWVNVSTGTAQNPTVVVSTVNPGVSLERGLCLTVALAGGAASECGDLRVAQGLPSVRTMGKVRAPTLIYSTAQAHPYPLVAAEVTLPAGAANPDSVELALTVNGTERRRARWAGSAFSPGQANRLVIGYDGLADTTGLYSYTLNVTNIYPGNSLSALVPGTGELIVVNRSQTEFGAGWWLAGLERLKLDSMLWISGDGSARVYRAAGTNAWAAIPLDRPDTLKKIGGQYVRLLPGKTEVWFDSTGRHIKTISRLQHDTTIFHRNASTGTLDSISVAPPAQVIRYKFVYNSTSGLLDSVIAPPAGSTPRATKLTRTGSTVTSIRDPDTSSVSFAYDGSFTNRIITRTDRIGTVASYFFDAAGKVVRDSLDPGSNLPVIVNRLRAHESAGFIGSPALDTAVASAAIDGPRTDVGDSTLFWANQFGAPRRVRNALGYVTTISRQNATYPALVTRTQGPTGRVMRAHYDVRGNVDSLTDSTTIVNGQPAVTRYAWDTTWGAVTGIIPPENDSIVIGIDPATGNRIFQQDASGSASRDTFTYYANGLLATAKEAGASAVTTLNYDALGNLREHISPLGFRDSVYYDNVGRDTLTVSPPLDSAGTTKFQRSRIVYDLVGRVLKTVTWAPAMPYTVTVSGVTADSQPVVGDSVVTQNTYDRESRLIEVDGGPTVELRSYDRAGRLLSSRVGSGPSSYIYDAAGNVISQSYRNGGTVTSQFDVLNRLVQRVIPRTAYPRTDCRGHVNGPITGDTVGGTHCLYIAPYFTNVLADSLQIPADTQVFAYDSAGNMVRADNRYAQVRRTYNLNGALATDTLRLRDYSDNAFGHSYTLRYGYDRDLRRGWMTLTGLSAADSFTYAYSAANGGLAQITDIAGRRYALTYKPNGRLDSLKVFAVGAGSPGIKESYQYDADGRLSIRDRRTSSNTLLQHDSLSYTPTARVLRANTNSAAASQGTQYTSNAYGGLGAVVASQLQNSGTGYWNLEEFRATNIGNVWYQHTRYAAQPTQPSAQSFYTPNGLLYAHSGAFPPGCTPGTVYLDTLYQVADGAGNVLRSGQYVDNACPSGQVSQTASNSYYSTDNHLMVVQKWTSDVHTWEEYWYDALGRRVLTRTRHDMYTCINDAEMSCPGFVERTVWDGDQLIGEERTSGLDQVVGGAPYYGTVRYVHLVGMDAPVAILDNRFSDARVIHYNWRGLAESSSFTDGSPADCELATGSCTRIGWNAGEGVYFKRNTNPYAGMTLTWIGSLPANGKGDAGLLYRRNRFFDPASGRFTQEDPIGLAGGLNLYGFAKGDPVTFSDPFGLFDVEITDAQTESEIAEMRAKSKTFDNAMRDLENNHEILVKIGEGSTLPCGGSAGCSQQLGRNEKGQSVYGVTWDPGGVQSENALLSLTAHTIANVQTTLGHEVYGHVVPWMNRFDCVDGPPGTPAAQSCGVRRENVIRRELHVPIRTQY
jgi:RHS repeat-associated protein